MMTKEQTLLVKKSWSIFREIDPVLVGDVFYSKLFFDMPYLEKLFHTHKKVKSLSLLTGLLSKPLLNRPGKPNNLYYLYQVKIDQLLY